MENNETSIRLKECFEKVGRRYGYDFVNAEFLPFPDLKVRWQRTYRSIDFRVSDYISDAPDRVFTNLAESIFMRLTGEDDSYSPELYKWVTRPDFHMMKQDLYLSRCKQLTLSTAGRSKDLMESYNRLIGAGLVPYDPTIALSWTKDVCERRMGGCSVLMRVVSISRLLDSDEIPDYVLDYCLYHELCHIMIGFDPTGTLHTDMYCGFDNKFPEKTEAVNWLKCNSIYV